MSPGPRGGRVASDLSIGERVGVVVGGAVFGGVVEGYAGGGAWRVDVGGRSVGVDVGAVVASGLPGDVRAAILGAARGAKQTACVRGLDSWSAGGGKGKAQRDRYLARLAAALPAPWWAWLGYPDGLKVGDAGRKLRLYVVDGLGNSHDVADYLG